MSLPPTHDGNQPAAPRFSICELTTLNRSFEEDLRIYPETGAEGIGLCEMKLPADDDMRAARLLAESGLRATICLPAVLSVLPIPGFGGPDEPEQRVEAICQWLRRIPTFGGVTGVVLTGPQGTRSEQEARAIVVQGLRTVARAAREAGVGIGLEPIHASAKDTFTMITTLPETVALIDEVGESNLGIMFDTWHLWDTPDVLAHIARWAPRFVGVHVNDWREPTRSWADRVLPGDGAMDLPALLGALEAGGFDGWYDLEIFSNDGTFGADFEDSLWKQDPVDVCRRGRTGFLRAWEARTR
jgi:sugar phosphate isomerase/epimerase